MARQWRTAIAAMVLGAAGTMVCTPTAAAEEAVLGTLNADTIADSYIVVFKDGATASPQLLTSIYRGKPGRPFSSGFSVSGMTEKQARRLAAHPSVDYVERDTKVKLAAPTWGQDRIDQRNLPLDNKFTPPNTASNVTAYVMDTGVRITHSEFEGRASDGYDFIDDDAVAQDCHSHGTHVAGTIAGKTYGVAKQAKIVGVRVLDCEGFGSSSDIVSAVDWITANGVKPGVVNMSLGFNGSSSAITSAIRRSINAGFTYVVAGGNSGADACGYSPAGISDVITVGASDKNDKRSVWPSGFSSNYGKCLDIWAPGTAVLSATHASDTATGEKGGTSMASPHVAGAAALYLSVNTGATNKQVRDALVNKATPNVLSDIKTGSPNLLLFVS